MLQEKRRSKKLPLVLGAALAGCALTGRLLWAASVRQASVETEVVVDGREFIKVDTPKSFDGARQYCLERGYDLASVETERLRLALAEPHSFHIGMRREPGTKGTDGFYFLNGAPYTSGEGFADVPQDSEDCASLTGRNYAGVSCASELSFICETGSPRSVVSMLFRDELIAVRAIGYGFDTANRFCGRFGTRLAGVYSAAQNAAIGSAMAALGVEQAWLGLEFKDGAFRWLTGAQANWNAFAMGAYSESDGQCAVLSRKTGANEWLSLERQSEALDGFICEGFTWIVVNVDNGALTGMTESQAQEYCRSTFGGELTTIHDSAMDLDIGLATKELGPALIGMSSQHGSDQWHWNNDAPVNYLNFAEGQPSTGNCVVSTPDGWQTVDCGQEQRNLVCTANNLGSAAKMVVVYAESKADAIVVGLPLDFTQANDYCLHKFGTQLHSISDATENEKYARATRAVGMDRAWIGLVIGGEPNFQWLDQNPSVYRNWAPNNPATKSHALLRASDGQWENVAGDVFTAGFICAFHGKINEEYTYAPKTTSAPVQTTQLPYTAPLHYTAPVTTEQALQIIPYTFTLEPSVPQEPITIKIAPEQPPPSRK